MLQEFITSHRDNIIARAKTKVATRTAPRPTEAELMYGVPLFCDQLIETLRLSQSSSSIISASSIRHGDEMLRKGFTVGQIVHDYGNIGQAITELALELHAAITVDEFHTLNRCLDDAIAEAVTEYGRQREQSILDESTERLGVLAHELRNHLATAMLSFDMLRRGNPGIGGSTGALLGRSLGSLRDLIDRSLAEVRLESAIQRFEMVQMSEFIEEVEVAAAVEARARGLHLTIDPVPLGVSVEVDRQLLGSAVANLLQNAFKFTRIAGNITLKTQASADRVLIEVEDECGGLPPEKTDLLFRPFEQWSGDRAGLGLGLAISRKAAKANRGDIRVRSLPGKGCVFTIDLPRLASP